ncbi:MAG: hypothetical protein J7J99_02275 [Thermoprotei archaeon]|nr:hypothetical protein [Thermoprotei archaeon]
MSRVLVVPGSSRKTLAVVMSIKIISSCEPYVLFTHIHPYMFSKYIPNRILARVNKSSHMQYLRCILDVATKYDIHYILPTDYEEVALLTKYDSVFKEHGITVIAPRHKDVIKVSNRSLVPELVKGITLYPYQVVIMTKADIKEVYKVPTPLVVKGTSDSSKPQYFLSPEEAIPIILKRIPVVVQEYIPGIGRGYYVVSYEGDPIIEFTHERIGEYYPTGGGSIAARGPINDPRLIAIGREIVKRLKWTGELMIETRWDYETGDYYVLEFNPKIWGSIDLSVSLGFHFPGLLVVAFTEGYEKALKVAREIKVREGYYIWIIDALHYLVYDPSFYLRLLYKSLLRPTKSEFRIEDIVSTLQRFAVKAKNLYVEKNRHILLLRDTRGKMKTWFKRLMKVLRTSNKRVLILDLDGVLVSLPVNWSKVKKELSYKGYIKPWETMINLLYRLWVKEKRKYYLVSELIKKYEEEAAKRAKLLINASLLERIKEKVDYMYIASRQARDVIYSILKMYNLSRYFDDVYSREDGPDKLSTIRCKIYKDPSTVIMIDDSFITVVKAYREGYIGLHVAHDRYRKIQVRSLGIPSSSPNDIMSFLLKVLKAN